MSEIASAEALRIVRSVEVDFPTGPPKRGTAFVISPGHLITCAHVVVNDTSQNGSKVTVRTRGGGVYEAQIGAIDINFDLARLDAPAEAEFSPTLNQASPSIGRAIVFAGQPQGVVRPAVFPGLVSDYGAGLVSSPRCELIQIAGMVNNGNSGGPLLDAENGNVLGVITAKYVPLLKEIDKLTDSLDQIPQVPSNVTIGTVDFSSFMNYTIRSMWQLSTVLRLVQVGTGWAVPAQHFDSVGV